jgi:hypothetical protein
MRAVLPAKSFATMDIWRESPIAAYQALPIAFFILPFLNLKFG